jgi:hypothetical protein
MNGQAELLEMIGDDQIGENAAGCVDDSRGNVSQGSEQRHP